MEKPQNHARRGQAMLIATLSLGGAILGATTIAGLLMLYQIRGTTDSANSAKAIFAADAGVEWALYSYFNPPQPPLPMFSNGVTVEVVCSDASSTPLSACDGSAGVPETAITKGTSASSRRAFLINMTVATTTLP